MSSRIISYLFPQSPVVDNDDLFLVVNAIDHYDNHLHDMLEKNDFVDRKKTKRTLIRLHRIKDRITRVVEP